MSHTITGACHKCGHRWTESLDLSQQSSYRGKKKTSLEEYEFSCPKCGTKVVWVREVKREA